MIPPIFPAPRNATFFPVRSFAMASLDSPFARQSLTRGRGIDFLVHCRRLFLHPVPRSVHNVMQVARGFPVEQRLRFRWIGDESGRIAGAPGNYFMRHWPAGDLLYAGDDLL